MIIECNEQRGTSNFMQRLMPSQPRMSTGNDNNMSGGVMRDIEERDDFSDSDDEMTDI